MSLPFFILSCSRAYLIRSPFATLFATIFRKPFAIIKTPCRNLSNSPKETEALREEHKRTGETLRSLLIPIMSATKCCIVFICLLLMFSSSWDVAMGGRYIPSSVPSTMRPASVDYVKMNPQVLPNHKHKVSHEKEVKSCMPKGFRRSSAPSRYVNYQTLGSSCATKAH
ncbi:hypothetical protein ERO13_D05G106401v2 [Gossypium hirsutum]|uniref:Transmembrane protein n=3 Tax=Gossypium TaxID=3633 RepID=A0A5J5REL6_GOSBA|nr:hypothetical protein ES319_D05G108000v1 [Gossypium barbadense]KAG4145633.1 hypothetical protein ERO13_D05G106401v2 [Gossypium hirsutum]PPD77769.1 hypothetical protein GOBAR_DD25318 [Gossypium barbadense]TYH70417.1 hypothetical protein ES332_D05G115700v1 [Gossypium tomentosum]